MTSEPGFASILSAKSEIDAPRRRRMILPLPRGTLTPPSDGASRISNSCRFVRFDLRCLLLPPPLPKAPAVPPPGPRPRPPPPPGRGPPKPPPGAPPGRWKPPPAPPGRRRDRHRRHRGAGSRRRRRDDRPPAPAGRGAGTRRAGARSLRARDVAGARALAHALRARERVVARTRLGGALAHALRARERVVAGTRGAGARRGARDGAGRLGSVGGLDDVGRRGCRGRLGRLACGRVGGLLLGLRLALGDRQRCVGGRGRSRFGCCSGLRRGLGARLAPARLERRRGAAPPSRRSPSASRAARSLRATGGSMVDEGPLTNSPSSLSFARAILLSTPSSDAISCTRGLAATILLSGSTPTGQTINGGRVSFRAVH